MEKVMNNNDLRRLIWSYLRKEAKISCRNCKLVCVWDKKKVNTYYYFSGMVEDEITNIYYCKKCWLDILPSMPFPCLIS